MKERSVVISLWSAGSCGRKQLAGILRYINKDHPWRVRIYMNPDEFTADVIRTADGEGVDGYIAFARDDAALALASSKTPTVLLSYPSEAIRKRRRGLSIFINDNEEIGRKGAEYLMSLGIFASYAFVPDVQGRGWSVLREESFRRRLLRDGYDCQTYDSECGDLASWLKSLPKPAAVMTPFDFRAREVVDACIRAKISMPDHVSVLGVDNDELICELSSPMISSITLDQEQIGYLAAEELDRLMSANGKTPTTTVPMSSGGIIERESTRPIAPKVYIARRIQSFINEHFKDGISASDVPTRLHISRRLAEMRFLEVFGKTIRQAIEERRLKEIKRYLSATNLPISKITRLCGIENELWIKYVFKRRIGMTMKEWRRKSQNGELQEPSQT